MAAALQWRMTTTPTWKQGVGVRFLGGRPPPTLGRVFREEEDNNEDDGDEQGRRAQEDVMMRSMFETLCKGETLSLLSMARPKRRSSVTTVARASGADPSRTK